MTPEKRRSFLSLLFVTTMDNFGFGLVFVMFDPLLLSPEYNFVPVATSLATRTLYLGLLFAAYPLTQLFGAPILGDIADRAGRKKALYITIIGVVIGFILSAIACIFTNLWFLIFSRLFTGFFAGNLSICMSAIADLSPSEKMRSRNFGIVTVVWGISWTVAMLTGGYLSDPATHSFFSPALPFWITAALTLLSLLAIAKYYYETAPSTEKHPFNLIKGIHNIAVALKLKGTRLFFLIILIYNIGWGLSVEWFGSYSIIEYKVTQQATSWALIIQGAFWMLGGSLLNPWLLKKYNTHRIATIGFFFTALCLFAIFFAKSYLLFCIFYWISAAFSSFAFSNSMNLASIHAPADVQGKVMGISQSMMSLGFVIVPIIGAYVGGKNAHWFYPISAVLLFACFLMLFFTKEKMVENP